MNPRVADSRQRGINYQVNKIREGLYGRGAWEHDLHCPPEDDIVETGTYSEDAFLESTATIVSDAVVPNDMKVSYRAGETVRLVPGFHAQAESRFHAFIHPCNAPGNSFTPKNLPSGSTHVGTPVRDRRNSAQLSIAPNPTRGEALITWSDIPADADAQLLVFDAQGKMVLEKIMRGPSVHLDLRDRHGLFVITVNFMGAVRSARISVE